MEKQPGLRDCREGQGWEGSPGGQGMLCFYQNNCKKGLLESLLQQTGFCGGTKHCKKWAGAELLLMLCMGSLRKQEMLQTGASALAFRLLWWRRKAPRSLPKHGEWTSVLCLISEPCKSQNPGGWKSPPGSWSPTWEQSPGESTEPHPVLPWAPPGCLDPLLWIRSRDKN